MTRHLTILAPALALLACTLPGHAAVVAPGHSALWYDPARDGEGLVLEIHDNDGALVTWYTYDEDGNQRWLIGAGAIVRDDQAGDRIEFPELRVTHGGRFGPDFDPDEVVYTVIGSASLVFQDCYHGQFSYDAFDQQGELALHRLTHTMAAGCRPIHGMTGEPVYSHAGQSGAWFDPSHNGEGWFLQWLAHNEAMITWYTYDGEGNQAWLLGTGTLDDHGTLVFEQLHGTRGAHFGAAFDPDDVQTFEWGRLELAIDCDNGVARYQSLLPGFGAGEYGSVHHLSRLAAPAGCPWAAPKLTDLYEFSLTRFDAGEIDQLGRGIVIYDMADDGTVVALGRIDGDPQLKLLRLQPGDDDWQVLPPPAQPYGSPPFISPDGQQIFISSATAPEMLTWDHPSQAWLSTPIPASGYSTIEIIAASPGRTELLGRGRHTASGQFHPWQWSAGSGLTMLPIGNDAPPVYLPVAASDDGANVYGTSHIWDQMAGMARPGAVRWHHGQAPEPLHDRHGARLGVPAATDRHGRIVFGNGHLDSHDNHPDSGQAWYWISPQQSGYLGTLPSLHPNPVRPWWLSDASQDGSIAVGSFTTGINLSDGFIWTQDTGLTSIREILEHADLLPATEADWPWQELAGFRISSTGDKILLLGQTIEDPMGDWRRVQFSAILHLTPKAGAAR
ncbi:MAG: hypothetical protein M0Q42_02120 [Xanthomonadales bacterium]|nr:hypothetical protein [Xanthomonadales bacterium]